MRQAVVAVIAALGLALAQAREARLAETPRDFQIATQPLSQALLEFSTQADVIVTAPSQLVRDQRAPEVRGKLLPSDALSRLLRNSGLRASVTDSGAIVIVRENRRRRSSVVAEGRQDAGPSETTSDVMIEEVLVTAQKRTESAQDVPSSVSVLNSSRVRQLHATTLLDYAAYIPGLNVSSGGGPGQTTITLRGIAPVGPGAVVGYYVDDAPLGSSSNYGAGREFGLDLMPYDVERIEVLRGPQGTLYGAGAMGGLLKYVLRRPSASDFAAWAGAETFGIASAADLGWGARAGANVPLVADRLGLWASYFEQRTPGYIDNADTAEADENDVEQRGARLALLWQIHDGLSLQLGGLQQRIHSSNDAGLALTLTGLDPPTGVRSFGSLTTSHPLPQPFHQDIDHYSASLDWNLGWATLLSASSYSRMRTRHTQDASSIFGILYPELTGGAQTAGYAPFDIRLDLHKRTEELRLASPAGSRIEWLVGAFYTNEDSAQMRDVFALDTQRQPIAQFAPRFVFVEFPSRYSEVAGFASATWRVSERFDLTGGVRWARNRQQFRQISGGVDSVIGPPADFSGRSSEDVVTYSVSPRWLLGADTMLYVRIAAGYRPGGPNPRILGLPATIDADTLTNYEVGVKASILGGRALINAAAFHIDWRDIQQSVIVGGVGGADNTGDAVSRGLELETVYLPVDRLRLGLNATYTDARLTAPEQGIAAARLGNTPRWSAAAVLDYEFAIAESGWSARIGGGWRHVGEQGTAVAAQTGADLSYMLPAYSAVDFSAELARGNWMLRLFARNVTDRRAYLGGALVADARNVPQSIEVNVLQPRTVGVSIDVGF